MNTLLIVGGLILGVWVVTGIVFYFVIQAICDRTEDDYY